jgi:hypothetical protein
MTKALALDVEATTHNKGNPYDSRNKLVCFSFATNEGANDSLMWNDLNKEILIEDSLPWADVVVGLTSNMTTIGLLRKGCLSRQRNLGCTNSRIHPV